MLSCHILIRPDTEYVQVMGRKSEVYTATINIGEMTREEAASKEVTSEAAANERELNNGLEVAVKLSRQPPNSVFEIELIKKAKDARAKHLPELVKCKDLLELRVKDGTREAFGKCGDDDVDNRVLRCIVAPRYTALSEQLRNNPDSLVEMAKQMIKCEYYVCFELMITTCLSSLVS